MRFQLRCLVWGLAVGVPVGAAAAPADGDLILLSDKSGRGMTIGAQEDLRESFAPGTYDGARIADAFKALCVDTQFDPSRLRAAAEATGMGFVARELTRGGSKKAAPFALTTMVSPSARASIYLGQDAGLKGQPILIRDRGIYVGSGYGTYRATGRQCNLDLRVTGFSAVTALVEQLNRHLGAAPAKLASKAGFADGHWNLTAGGAPARVSFAVVGMSKPNQLVHLVLQETPVAAK